MMTVLLTVREIAVRTHGKSYRTGARPSKGVNQQLSKAACLRYVLHRSVQIEKRGEMREGKEREKRSEEKKTARVSE